MIRARGFTLIELLVTIGLIGILSAIVINSFVAARAKGIDARIKADLYNIELGIQMFHDANAAMPANQTPGAGYCNNQANFLSDVIAGGFLPKTIQTPVASGVYYCYYDYGADNDIGALIVSTLQGADPSTGYPGTCRPWPTSANWCSATANTYYCVCLPY